MMLKTRKISEKLIIINTSTSPKRLSISSRLSSVIRFPTSSAIMFPLETENVRAECVMEG